MKNNITHYQHYANAHQHPKFKMLRVKYGWEGEGKFWALNNMIADSDQCQLDLSRKFNVANILDLFQMQPNEFTDYINFLVDDCELINRVGDIITTETVQENYYKVMSKRVRNKTDYESKTNEPEIQNSETPKTEFTQNIQTSENTQSKVKESKVEESKKKESKVNSNPTKLTPQNIAKLFNHYTRITNPNQQTHINPIIKILETIPPELTDQDIQNCLTQTFSKLHKERGVMMEFLLKNIRSAISIKHEEILSQNKNIEINNVNIHSKNTSQFQNQVLNLTKVLST